ncbi:hypothetical protein BST81_01725 [Leptolyngbya sp. 'hensonii']|uniref:WD40 repeat domain-containing protein n=1 Tax=Leptolyngbya sp. 'hensonii' TaxID=1922337 RepID=UPI00094FB769|nr:WD40 repeat domain-containing protein [Leptolyngbya sp. 'hensonii']OLP20176.1 hypothetical protein BST81_01725 [Leptolyngbya sp. 'hensonii']
MNTKLIQASLSAQVVNFQPGGAAAGFEVLVDNYSDRFATFQLEVLAPGAHETGNPSWYRLSPEVAAKKPPGDRTRFVVEILDSPVPGFSGSMNLTVRIFSLELGEERKVLRLVLGKGADVPIRVDLPVQRFEAHPLEQVNIPVSLENQGQDLALLIVTLTGIPPDWIESGPEQRLQLKASASTELTFRCQLPETIRTLSQVYSFTVQVIQAQGPSSQATGLLQVVPQGTVEFTCLQTQQQYPQRWGIWWWRAPVLTPFPLQLRNDSNVISTVRINIETESRHRCIFQVLPDDAPLKPGEVTPIDLGVRVRRYWWRGQSVLLQVQSQVADARINVLNDTLLLKLKVLPRIHPAVQLLWLALILYGLWWASWLNPASPLFGHRGAVNAVQLSGTSDQAVSASDDQTVIQWWVPGFFNPFLKQYIGPILQDRKAVRVVRLRPIDNNWLAAGLENGEIKLQSLEVARKPLTFAYQVDDRVLDLRFTRDARTLFSAHGSGRVLQWQIPYVPEAGPISVSSQPLQQKRFDFAVYGLAIVGDQTLAIGGRFNQLTLWNWEKDEVQPVAYPRPGGQDAYLTSLTSAEFRPYLLVTADNQGYITLWNLRPCLMGDQPCEVLDEWQDGHGKKPVRSVALSPEGCYLSSGGADGRVVLWPLSADGRRASRFMQGIELMQVAKPFNSVDVRVAHQDVLVVGGNEDWQVRVVRSSRLPAALCDVTDR